MPTSRASANLHFCLTRQPSTRSVCPAVMRQRLWWRLAVRGGMSLVTLAIGPGLFPVAAQCRLAPAPRRGLGALIDNPLTFLRLLMPHAVVHELSQVQRVGEIVEIRQLVRNMKFTRFPGHRSRRPSSTPSNSFYWLTQGHLYN